MDSEITVNLHLKGAPRRYNSPAMQTKLAFQFGSGIENLEAKLDAGLALLRRRILISCGKERAE